MKETKKDLIFARFDVSRYDIPELKVEDIPTVYMILRGGKGEFVEYGDDEKVSEFTEFIEKHYRGGQPKSEL